MMPASPANEAAAQQGVSSMVRSASGAPNHDTSTSKAVHSDAAQAPQGLHHRHGGDVPMYIAMQNALASQKAARERALQNLRRHDRERRLQSREALHRDAPQGVTHRIDRVLHDVQSSALARLLHASVASPVANDSDDDASVASVPDPGWSPCDPA